MRGVGDFQLDEGISLTFELNGLASLASRAAEEHIAVTHVLEHYRAIVCGMMILFHFFIFLFVLKRLSLNRVGNTATHGLTIRTAKLVQIERITKFLFEFFRNAAQFRLFLMVRGTNKRTKYQIYLNIFERKYLRT